MNPNGIPLIKTLELLPDPHNLRQQVEPEAFKGLVESVAVNGIYLPLIVRRKGDGFVVIDGHRRLAAAKLTGLTEVPCVVLEGDMTLAQARKIALTVHLQNDPPHFSDTAKAMAELKALEGCSNAEIARMLGVSAALVCKYLAIMRLPPEVLAKPGTTLSELYDAHCRRQRVKKPDRRKRYQAKADGFVVTVMADAKASAKTLKNWFESMQVKLNGLKDDDPISKAFA
jgi:ParB/RepB/Spo0J family partition protein